MINVVNTWIVVVARDPGLPLTLHCAVYSCESISVCTATIVDYRPLNFK